MTERDKFLSQPVDNTLGAAIELGWDRFRLVPREGVADALPAAGEADGLDAERVVQEERPAEVLHVEVKGTQTTGEDIFLTAGEVNFARRHPGMMALFVLHSVEACGHGHPA